jgi:hypothetical protein
MAEAIAVRPIVCACRKSAFCDVLFKPFSSSMPERQSNVDAKRYVRGRERTFSRPRLSKVTWGDSLSRPPPRATTPGGDGAQLRKAGDFESSERNHPPMPILPVAAVHGIS